MDNQASRTEKDDDLEKTVQRLYTNTVCLAPMVRAGCLPLRLLALDYGADAVWGEELVDRSILATFRRENPILDTVEYIAPGWDRGKKKKKKNRSNNNNNGCGGGGGGGGGTTANESGPSLGEGPKVIFSTSPRERGRVVYQLGTSDPQLALKAALHVQRDVAAIDINMGCPKAFSLQGGMGSALLKQPERSEEIVKTLRKNLDVPVSVKIRLLDTDAETVDFARRMEAAGANALSVHMRTVAMRPKDKALWDRLKIVVDAVSIPVVANGDIYTREDITSIKQLSGCSSVMLARPALLNCSVFRPNGPLLATRQIARTYLLECMKVNLNCQGAKYVVREMMSKGRSPAHRTKDLRLDLTDCPTLDQVVRIKNLRELCCLWGLEQEHDEIERKWKAKVMLQMEEEKKTMTVTMTKPPAASEGPSEGSAVKSGLSSSSPSSPPNGGASSASASSSCSVEQRMAEFTKPPQASRHFDDGYVIGGDNSFCSGSSNSSMAGGREAGAAAAPGVSLPQQQEEEEAKEAGEPSAKRRRVESVDSSTPAAAAAAAADADAAVAASK